MPLPLQALAEQQQASDMQQERELRRQGEYMAAAAAEAVIRDCADRRQSLDQVTAALPTVLKHWGGGCLSERGLSASCGLDSVGRHAWPKAVGNPSDELTQSARLVVGV